MPSAAQRPELFRDDSGSARLGTARRPKTRSALRRVIFQTFEAENSPTPLSPGEPRRAPVPVPPFV